MSQHTYLCPMRWGDMDALGHINNASYIDYLQEARVDFLLSRPPAMGQLLETGVLVTGHQVEYLHPVAFGVEPLTINLWVDSIGAARFSIGYHVWLDGQLVARARTAAAPYDLSTGRLRRLTADERAGLASVQGSSDPLRQLPRVRWQGRDHVHPFLVRWSDLDPYRHVNNVMFYDYLQEARIQLAAELLNSGPMGPGGMGMVLARQDLEYLRPMDFRREPYQVHSIVSAIGTSSYTIAAEIREPETGKVYAASRSVVVCIDSHGASAPILGPAREHLGQWLHSADRNTADRNTADRTTVPVER